MKKKHAIIGFTTLILVLGMAIFIIIINNNSFKREIDEKNKKLDATTAQLNAMTSMWSSASYTKDSLSAINKLLSRYRALTDAMSYRDSIRKPLSFDIGDVVFLKRDSSRVIIKDILVGGGKYEHYIKYQVLYRDNSTETIAPELIFNK